jgi:hypothetical protein
MMLALAAALLMPAAGATAQDQAEGTGPEVAASPAAVDPRIVRLEALMPAELAGTPLADSMTFATGEELVAVMRPEEADIVLSMLDEHGKTVSDYAAASTFAPASGTDVIVVQAHRIAGIDASQTKDDWANVLSVSLEDPLVAETSVAGHPVLQVTGASVPDALPLYVFAAGDVLWMVATGDRAVVESAMAVVGADGSEAADSQPAT